MRWRKCKSWRIYRGNEDGVIVIPKGKEEEILEATLEKLRKDQQREQKYLGSREKALEYLDSILK